jgi:drug/metabolite transporter (DMT)-like permease
VVEDDHAGIERGTARRIGARPPAVYTAGRTANPEGLMNVAAVGWALGAAALFGFSTPAAKALLGRVDPWLLAGLLYLGSGLGLALWRALRPKGGAGETALARRDLPWLAGAIFFGGVAGPVLLMAGLSQTEASAASLFLTLEGVATALIAWFVFHENFDRRIALGMGLIASGAVVLSWQGAAAETGMAGPLALTGACVAWGIDNNLTRKVSLADPAEIAMIKGLAAGTVNLTFGLWAGAALPSASILALAGVVGFLGYGVSLVLFVLALRHLGTARTGAYFSTAPFLGAAAATFTLGEPVTLQLAAAGALMGAGVWLHLTEKHAHEHAHEPLGHAHMHVHDEHHRHAHGPNDAPGEPHAHWHRHPGMKHSHPHVPDMHHQHRH